MFKLSPLIGIPILVATILPTSVALSAALPPEVQALYGKITCKSTVEKSFYADEGYQNALKYWLFTRGETADTRTHSMAQPFILAVLETFYNRAFKLRGLKAKELADDLLRASSQGSLTLTLKDLLRYREELAVLSNEDLKNVPAFGFEPILPVQAGPLYGLLPWDLLSAQDVLNVSDETPDFKQTLDRYFLNRHWFETTRNYFKEEPIQNLFNQIYFDYTTRFPAGISQVSFQEHLGSLQFAGRDDSVFLRLTDPSDLGNPTRANLTMMDFRKHVIKFLGIYEASLQTLP